MGALCGKESRGDNFTGPGRRLDSPPPEVHNPTARLPSNKRVVGGPPRTLGGPSSASGGGGGASAAGAADARRMAAEAAEVRATAANKATGKLGSQLQQQKKQTMNKTILQAAEEDARRKEIESRDARLSYN